MIKAGEMKPVIDTVVPLDVAIEGLRLIQDRKVIGKVIVEP
jgi:alcohol dehydrogenase